MQAKRYAVLGDIHANLPALEAVLEDAAACDVTDYISVGDIVGYNAHPSECLRRIRELVSTVVRGNHDHYCAHEESLDDFHPLAANVIDWTRRQLSDDDIQYLRSLRYTRVVGGFTLVHSTLDMPEKWGYVFDTLEADAHFTYQTSAVCFYGHTHVPVTYQKSSRVTRTTEERVHIRLGTKYFVNGGSVGQPRDGDPRAAYVIYDTENRVLEFRRVPYDIQKAQASVRDAGLPERLAVRLALGK
jgi:diadenosine tetraphosphatase ApaH/serine/threonine PP2A family protein phosphatase